MRGDNLDALPFADVADPDPDALPFGRDCDGCGARADEDCRPWCVGEAARADAAVARAREAAETATCRHCGREVDLVDGRWIDPEATGDDSVWRETCDENHEDRIAAHEPPVPCAIRRTMHPDSKQDGCPAHGAACAPADWRG